mmetsp:Transcript_82000/g.264694  ORF Transcript_82000/g.264694 Transcript_82000/m.264694 type:complete len:332 (-) Transcript_82000:1246-2241(-)
MSTMSPIKRRLPREIRHLILHCARQQLPGNFSATVACQRQPSLGSNGDDLAKFAVRLFFVRSNNYPASFLQRFNQVSDQTETTSQNSSSDSSLCKATTRDSCDSTFFCTPNEASPWMSGLKVPVTATSDCNPCRFPTPGAGWATADAGECSSDLPLGRSVRPWRKRCHPPNINHVSMPSTKYIGMSIHKGSAGFIVAKTSPLSKEKSRANDIGAMNLRTPTCHRPGILSASVKPALKAIASVKQDKPMQANPTRTARCQSDLITASTAADAKKKTWERDPVNINVQGMGPRSCMRCATSSASSSLTINSNSSTPPNQVLSLLSMNSRSDST